MAVDDKEYLKGWTVQQGPAPEKPEDVPGTVVTPEQLPSKDALKAAGIDPDQLLSGLVVGVDEHEKALLRGEDPKTPAPGEVVPAAEAPAEAAPEAPAEAEPQI